MHPQVTMPPHPCNPQAARSHTPSRPRLRLQGQDIGYIFDYEGRRLRTPGRQP